MGIEIGGVLAGLVLAALFVATRAADRRKVLREAALIGELRDVELVNRELWDSLGPEHYGQLVYFYMRGRETTVRADFVIAFWNKAGSLYVQGLVKRGRLLRLLAPKCHGYWQDYAGLVRHLKIVEPARIAGWRKLERDAERYVRRRDRKVLRIKVAA